MTDSNSRHAGYDISPLFLDRWSPRAFTAEEIPEATLMTLFEAARWAPSSFNLQPWRFIYARRDTPAWPQFLSLLGEFNQAWAKHAAALVFVASKTTAAAPGSTTETPSYTHSFDAGAAWAMLALQASLSGWVAHGMAGFDKVRTASELGIPENFRVEAAIAIGRRGDKSTLPAQLQAREAPNDRAPLASLVFADRFRVD